MSFVFVDLQCFGVCFVGFLPDLTGCVRIWTQLWRQSRPAPHVEGDGCERDLGGDLGQTDIADAGEAHALLEGCKGGFDCRSSPGDQPVVAFEAVAEAMMLVGPARDARLHYSAGNSS